MNYKMYSALTGFSVWLIATLAFRWWGESFFLVEHHLLMAGFYGATVPIILLICRTVFQRFKLGREQVAISALAMAIPGMLGDVLSLKFHAWVFPNLNPDQVGNLGAWVLWAYVLVLISPLVLKARKN